jgi:hypothetical protein
VKESFTAAIVVRSLLAAERSRWVVGVLVGEVVDRLVVCWPVGDSVVVAVDMKWFLFWFVEEGVGLWLTSDARLFRPRDCPIRSNAHLVCPSSRPIRSDVVAAIASARAIIY